MRRLGLRREKETAGLLPQSEIPRMPSGGDQNYARWTRGGYYFDLQFYSSIQRTGSFWGMIGWTRTHQGPDPTAGKC